jgi:hypothetical protein
VMAALAVAAPSRGRVRAALLPPVVTGATSVTALRLTEARTAFRLPRCTREAIRPADRGDVRELRRSALAGPVADAERAEAAPNLQELESIMSFGTRIAA